MKSYKKILIFTVTLFSSFAIGSPMFTGNETIPQIMDKFKSGQSSLYDQQIVVHTPSGSYDGKLIGLGSSFLILESDTGRSALNAKGSQKIFSQKLVSVSSITGFEFKITK